MEKKEKNTPETKKSDKKVLKPDCKSAKKTDSEQEAQNKQEESNLQEPLVKKRPEEVEIVEPEEINDYYDFVDFNWDGTTYSTTLPKKFEVKKKYEMPNPKHIKAFIPGIIQKVYVNDGSNVKQNDILLVLEAMKMKNNLIAPFAGTIKKVYVKQGQQVMKNELLIELK